VWDGLVYDPDTNLVIAGTGNPEPWPEEMRGIPKSDWGKWDNLYTCSIVAVDANTGKLKWYYQTVPSDAWDLDSVGGFIMADVQIEGKTRKVIMQAPKSGVFYILDRTNGQFISAEPFVPVNWVTGFERRTMASRSSIRTPTTIRQFGGDVSGRRRRAQLGANVLQPERRLGLFFLTARHLHLQRR
jgi:glucose dehydrogenase